MFGRKKGKEKVARKKVSKESFKKSLRIFKYFKKRRLTFAIGFFFLFITGAAALFMPRLMGEMLGASSETSAKINDIAIMLMVVFGAQAVAGFFRIYLFAIVTQNALGELKKDIYGHLVRLPMLYFSTHRVGELSSRISADVALIQTTFTTTIAELIRQLIIVVGGIVLMSIASIKLTLFMLAVVPVIAIVAVIFGKYIKKLSKLTQDKIAESNTTVEETLQGIYNVKAFTNESFEINRYDSSLQDIIKISIKNAKWRGSFASFIIFVVFGAIVSVVWYGAQLVQSGEGGFNVGQLIEFILLTVLIGASIGGMADLFAQLQNAIGATENLLDILDEEPETNTSSEAIGTINDIKFDSVKFAYPNREKFDIIKDVSFNISAGQHIGIVGPSGSGKSTIAALLYRFYNVVDGSIQLNGKDISAYELTSIRDAIGIVPQDVFLFGGSIKENIKYGNPACSDEEVYRAAEEANAHEFIESFPEGYSTLVGERGIQLSGGQRQRIAIARAILKNPQVLLMDEATSSLDTKAEKAIQAAMENVRKKRTTITIAHRLSTIRTADKILVIQNGKLVEQGNHDELIDLNQGVYRSLHSAQTVVG